METGRHVAAAIDSFVIREQVGAAGTDDEEWRALIERMATLRSGRHALLGRLPFLTDEWLAKLVEEARELRAGAQPTGAHAGQAGQRVASPGPVARKLVVHPDLRRLVRDTLGVEPRPPYHASYLYYDRPGAGIVPHVDDPEFAINMIVMVAQTPADGGRSAIVLHPARRAPVRAVLEPGEAVLLEADGLVHAREPMKPGEQVTILSIGFSRPD